MLNRSVFFNPSFSLFIIRLTLGFFMLVQHGMPKLLSYGSRSGNFPNPLGLGSELSLILVIFAEVFCSIVIMLGIKVRLTVIPLIITMLVAIFIVHLNAPLAKRELAILYLAGYVALLFGGAGQWSLKASWFYRK